MISYSNNIYSFFDNYYSQSTLDKDEVLGVEQLLLKFGEQKPDLDLFGIGIYNTEGVPFEIWASPKDLKWSHVRYIINPYNGEIITKDYGTRIMTITFRIHRFFSLHYDDWQPYGNQVVGISTFVFIFLIISGIYLYLPNVKRKFITSFKISFKSKGYKFLYKLHTALGVWLTILFLTMSFTGVYLTYDFIKNIVNPIVVEIEKEEEKPSIFFNVNELERISTTNTNKIKEIGEAFELVKKEINNNYSKIFLPMFLMHENNRFYEFNYWDKNETKTREGEKTIAINMKRKRVMQTQDAYVKADEDDKVFDELWLKSIMTDLHIGSFFGPIGTFIWFISCLIFVVFPITGFMMTYRRMKRKRVG